ncbi:MAG: phosphoribosylaminoimidazolesuccinocarboxamide synthase [Oscillospiraceae bacterium]|nr:phosphoribosylaminoimidazolesuccinocarboxamide synthase [Oscillospiraceae bacterium]
MKSVYKGKTKDVYQLDDGNYLLKFKDDVTGENGIFDPGANTVGARIEGMGRACIRISEHFFKIIEAAGIPTHFVSSDVENATMTVKPAVMFGNGLEVICRYKAVGSFMRRYGMYAKEGQDLDALVEVTLKDDERQDPLITNDALDMLGLLTLDEYEILKSLTKKICNLIKDDLAGKGAVLYDIKLEFGRVDGRITLVDEIAGGSMRVFKNGKRVEPLDLISLILS